jgi:hypothetical protein
VGLLARNHLTPVAQQNVSWLLGNASLAEVAVWADQYIEGNNKTSFWHYVNMPLDATSYDRDRHCPSAMADRWIFADRLRVGVVAFLAVLWAFRLPVSQR